MKNILTIAALFMATASFGQGNTGEVIGTILEKETNESAFNAHIYIDDNGRKYNARADEDGRFRISGIPAGTYLVNVRYKGDTLTNILADVPMDGFFQMGTVLFESGVLALTAVDAVYDRNALKLIDGNLPVATLTAEEIGRSPVKTDVKALINSMSSDVRMTNDGELVFRGARKGDMLYLMDGVKTESIGNVPSCSIGRLMVYTGGLPAKYGDTMGGVVVMESKSYFDLHRKWVSSQLKSGKM